MTEYQIGQQVRLGHPLEYVDVGAMGVIDIDLPKGAVGTVIDLGDDLNQIVIVKFTDQTYACLAEWDNCVCFDKDSDGDKGIGVASDFLTIDI